MEVERLVVQEFSLQQLEQNNQPDILHLNGKEDPSISQETVSTKKKRKHKPRLAYFNLSHFKISLLCESLKLSNPYIFKIFSLQK